MAVENAQKHAIDPLAQQAAGLLAKAMVTSHDPRVVHDRLGD